jgi:hypothetical protein
MNSENRDFKVLDNNFVIGWVVKTVFAILIGVAVGFAVAQLLFCTHSVTRELLGSILLGIIVGAFVGVAQSKPVSAVVRDPKLWVIASIAGWTIAIFLFEINWPISRCMTSSNAPSYTPGNLIKTVHRPIFMIAEKMEKVVKGQIVYTGIYTAVTGLLMGVVLGIPQGIGQWLVLRKNMPGSLMMIWANALIWAITYFLIIFVIELVNFNQILTIMLIPVVLIVPAALTALMFVWLQKRQIGAIHK